MKKVFVLLIIFMFPVMQSCEHAFPNKDLDNYWRLRTIEYVHGDTVQVENTMFGFARHIVFIEDLANGFSLHGITIDTGDSLTFDYSMYPDTAAVLIGLNRLGIDSTVTTFAVRYPKNKLILTNSRVTLTLDKW